jgi:hypothetical protein
MSHFFNRDCRMERLISSSLAGRAGRMSPAGRRAGAFLVRPGHHKGAGALGPGTLLEIGAVIASIYKAWQLMVAY